MALKPRPREPLWPSEWGHPPRGAFPAPGHRAAAPKQPATPDAEPPSPQRWSQWLKVERALALWMHRASGVPAVVLVLMAVSWLGDGYIWYAFVLGLPFAGGPMKWQCLLHMTLLGAVNLQVYWFIKRRIARPRPFVTCPGIRACARSLDEFSFPSGHAMHAVAYSLVLTAYYPSLAAPLWTFTALIAVSRVVLGLHYPSDVVIGAALGLFMAELSLRFV